MILFGVLWGMMPTLIWVLKFVIFTGLAALMIGAFVTGLYNEWKGRT